MADNIYVDLTVSNLVTNRIPASFNERRNGSILESPSDFDLRITRFQVTTSALPVFVPIIAINSDDSNKTMLEITMSHNNLSVTTPVQWIPEIKNIPIPIPPSQNKSGLQSYSEYYYAYSYSWLPFLVQKTLQKCFKDLQTLDTSIATAGKPYFYNNSTSNIKIYFNQALYSLFSSFNSTYDGTLYEIIVTSNNVD